jgi:hypothetical protein
MFANRKYRIRRYWFRSGPAGFVALMYMTWVAVAIKQTKKNVLSTAIE